MEQYRVIKEECPINQQENNPFSCHVGEVITFYLVQVKGLFFWHTIKIFKKIRPAAKLLRHLRELKDE